MLITCDPQLSPEAGPTRGRLQLAPYGCRKLAIKEPCFPTRAPSAPTSGPIAQSGLWQNQTYGRSPLSARNLDRFGNFHDNINVGS